MLLVYGYATGVFSRRKLERATSAALAFRYLAANTHPDTLAAFRKRVRPELAELSVQALSIMQPMTLVRLGQIALGGRKLKAQAAKPKALSHGPVETLEVHLREEVQARLAKAEATSREELPDGLDLPAELSLREARLNALTEAKAQIEARAKGRFEAEHREYEDNRARREAQRQAGKTPRGKEPPSPKAGPGGKDQVNLTGAEPRIRPVPGGGFDQADNVQAAAAAETMLVLAIGITQQTNGKPQAEPLLDAVAALPEALGQAKSAAMDHDGGERRVQIGRRDAEPFQRLGVFARSFGLLRLGVDWIAMAVHRIIQQQGQYQQT